MTWQVTWTLHPQQAKYFRFYPPSWMMWLLITRHNIRTTPAPAWNVTSAKAMERPFHGLSWILKFRSIDFFFNQDKNAQRTLLQDASNWTQLPFWPEMESTALPPLSDPALPPCSAGEVRSVEPSVAAVLPTSSSLPGADAVVSDRWPPSREPLPCN